MSHRLGVDIGGTFTDVVLLGDDGTVLATKVPSTPDDYSRGVVDGAVALLRTHNLQPDAVDGIVHASTVASNTILEGLGARTGLITTVGFRDVLEMRRLRIPVLYDIQYEQPPPLVPRRRRVEVDERLGPRGEHWRELDEGSVVVAAETLREAGVEAVAIALLHAYADDAHERRVAEIVREVLGPGLYVTRSSEILPEIREYERTSTAVVNAYVGPALTRYVRSLVERLAASGLEAPLEVMQSAGGTLDPETSLRRPAHLIESGPAAGVMACSHLGRLTGRDRLISFDMGGTTAKAALVEDGRPVRTGEYEVGAGINLSSRLVKGGGHPVKLPFIDVSEIGAGGGSIVQVDEHGSVRVGPMSAGAVPGPACYGTGGTEPTLTDALVVLGHLPERELGNGAITVDRGLALEAIERAVARPLGRPVDEVAHGILQLAVATMTRAVKAVTTYRGRDPRDFTLCAFGGNGPVTGIEVARSLGVTQVLIPPAPGVFSALGLLFSDSEHEVVRTLMLRGTIDPGVIDDACSELEAEALAYLRRGGPVEVSLSRHADVRYAGQAYELTVDLPPGPADVDRIAADFTAEHVRTYGHGSTDDPLEIVAVRVIARVERTSAQRYDPMATLRATPRAVGVRTAYFGPAAGWVEAPSCNRAALLVGELHGPLLVDEPDSTCVVPPGCTARVDAFANIEVEIHG